MGVWGSRSDVNARLEELGIIISCSLEVVARCYLSSGVQIVDQSLFLINKIPLGKDVNESARHRLVKRSGGEYGLSND